MKGVAYKRTFAAKGSQLHTAIEEGRPEDANRIYAETTARAHALLAKLAVPSIKYELDKEGKQIANKWWIESADAVYDKHGKLTKLKGNTQ